MTKLNQSNVTRLNQAKPVSCLTIQFNIIDICKFWIACMNDQLQEMF